MSYCSAEKGQFQLNFRDRNRQGRIDMININVERLRSRPEIENRGTNDISNFMA